ncbi:MAG: ParB/RepB/Spo0J family partition protein [Oligoflexia bacterium]|nr:ParB/RepB/Spo0J family partition protein [Oligoflexia bacterium]
MSIEVKHDPNRARKVLGRGLASLLPDVESSAPGNNVIETERFTADKKYFMCPVELLSPCNHQPRQTFDDDRLLELAESIRENGVIQPLVVRTRGSRYEIIAGERRWRASKLAGLSAIPVVVKDVSDKTALQTALVENIQRADLNSIEEARAYKQLIEEFSMTQEDVSKKVGKERSSITNYLRLLKLPEGVQSEIIDGNIAMGHARALCSIEDENSLLKAAAFIVDKKFSVRETENLVKKLNREGWNAVQAAKPRQDANENDAVFSQYEDTLRERFHTKVQIRGKYEKGKFIIEYFNREDFDRLLGELCSRPQ